MHSTYGNHIETNLSISFTPYSERTRQEGENVLANFMNSYHIMIMSKENA